MKADLVLKNGEVLTMNRSRPQAQAIAIVKDKIVKVGTNKEVSPWTGSKTRIINLKGKVVIPGLIDAHIHVADFGRILTWIDLVNARSIEEIKIKLKHYAEEKPKGKWIIGQGWNEANLAEKRSPTATELDVSVPENPTILYHQLRRTCIVNSRALELAGITKNTLSPAGGEIEKDPSNGKPTGILHGNATDLIWKIVPPPDEEETAEHVKLAFEKIVEAGITSVHWIAPSFLEIKALLKLREKNQQTPRVCIILPVSILSEPKIFEAFKETRDTMLQLCGAIIFEDGALASRTAALSLPYNDAATTGKTFYTQEEMDTLIAEVCKNKLQPVVHAMGDKAINMALNAIEKNLQWISRKNLRPRIEQAAVLNLETIQHMKKLGTIVSIQPLCVASEFTVWSAIYYLGTERARWLYPVKTLMSTGVKVCGGTDCPMETVNIFKQIKAAVTRQYFSEEQITLDEALQMYTVNAAYAAHEEAIKGTIEEGKLADLTVISNNPFKTSPAMLDRIKVEMTVIGGKIVYQRNNNA